MAFLIVACVLLIVNAIFLVGSLIYTLKDSKRKGETRLSVASSQMDPRRSLVPQAVLYDAIVRLSGNPVLGVDQFQPPPVTEKSENETK